MTEPVNASGVVPEVTVRPWTGWSRVSADTGNGTAQSPVGSTDCAGLEADGGGRQAEPEYGGERSQGTAPAVCSGWLHRATPFPETKSWT